MFSCSPLGWLATLALRQRILLLSSCLFLLFLVVLVVLCGVLAGVFKPSFHTPVQTALYQHSKIMSSDFPMNGRFWGMGGFGMGICHTSLH